MAEASIAVPPAGGFRCAFAGAQNVGGYPSKNGSLLARIFQGVKEFDSPFRGKAAAELGVRFSIIGLRIVHVRRATIAQHIPQIRQVADTLRAHRSFARVPRCRVSPIRSAAST